MKRDEYAKALYPHLKPGVNNNISRQAQKPEIMRRSNNGAIIQKSPCLNSYKKQETRPS